MELVSNTGKAAQAMHKAPGRKLLVEGLSLLGMKAKCDSEDGELKAVALHPPDYLSWTKETAINRVQASSRTPTLDSLKIEHELLVETLLSEGADVILSKPHPSCREGVYQRDSLGVIGCTRLAASFKFDVRKPETALIKGAQSPWKGGDVIEFGDVLVFGDSVLVGLGDRTNMMAVETLRQVITSKEIIPVPLVPGTLHLDYATTIGGRGSMKSMVVCPDLYQDREMISYIKSRYDVRHVISVPLDKHFLGWANLFYINPETVVSTTSAQEVNRELRKIGFKVHEVPFDAILAGEGAPRCCTAPILRAD